MTQTQIDYFLKTYETGNIALAAESLFVSRSAVSRAISDLEKEFQAELFVRTKAGVVPSKAGTMAYEVLRNINGSYTMLRERIGALDAVTHSKQVCLGVTPTNSDRFYRQYIRQFLEQYPDTELTLVEESRKNCKELLANGEIDGAVIPMGTSTGMTSGGFSSIGLYTNRLVLWVNADSSYARKEELDISDILDAKFGYLRAPMPMEDALNSCFSVYWKKPNIIVRTSSVNMLRQMVIDGRACAFAPDDLFEPSDRIRAVPLRFFKESVNSLLWNPMVPCSERFRELVSYLGGTEEE